MPRHLIALVAATASFLAVGVSKAVAQAGGGLEIRFCPAGVARTYPLHDASRAQGLVLQNIAVRNGGATSVSLEEIELTLSTGGDPVDIRRLTGATLEATIKGGARMAASGIMTTFPAQFCDHALLPAEAAISDDRALAPGEAILLTRQVFAWRGARDQARVRVTGKGAAGPAVAEAAVAIDSTMSKAVFRFPLRGEWFVPVAATPHGGHRWGRFEEFALDIVQLGDGTSSHRGAGAAFADYYAYGAQVRAAADGKVVAAVGGQTEDVAALRRVDETLEAYGARVGAIQAELIGRGVAAVTGDHVIIDHGGGEYSIYAHLKPGGISVKAGQMVKAGDPIAQLGSSGNSTEPHLHFQVCDAPSPVSCSGIPINFIDIELPYADGPRAVQAGDIVRAR